VPYKHLYTPVEAAAARADEDMYFVDDAGGPTTSAESGSATGVEADNCRTVALFGLPDALSTDALAAWVAARVAETSVAFVVEGCWVDGRGSGTLLLGSSQQVRGACSLIDGATLQLANLLPGLIVSPMLPAHAATETSSTLVVRALPLRVSARWKGVHRRLHDALSKLTGTRSFQNFCPHFASPAAREAADRAADSGNDDIAANAVENDDDDDDDNNNAVRSSTATARPEATKGAAALTAFDPKSVRTVYRCRARLLGGWQDFASSSGGCAQLVICGRSFLYRQILSMCGAVVAVVAGLVQSAFLDWALR
jgi:hypothetical protein